MTSRILDYVVVGASSPADLREKVMKHLTQDPRWELAGPATHALVTEEGDWYAQTLVRYWQENKPSAAGLLRTGGCAMTRPLQQLADELLSSEMDSYHEVVRAADAVLYASSEPDWCPLCADLEQYGQHDDECAMLLYERAVEEWQRMNAAREAREKANE